MRRHGPARLVAVFVTAATSLVGSAVLAAPADAAACPTETGVSVVVDFNGLGGGVQGTCESDGGGKSASTLFVQAGFPLTYAQRQPGFVCRVSGVPTSDPCVNTSPANAFWALWWSDGKSGRWTYSTLGASSLTIPDGGYVGFSFDDVDGQAPPSTTPSAHAAPPPPPPSSPTPDPTPDPTPSPGPGSEPGTGASTDGSGGNGGASGGGNAGGNGGSAPPSAPDSTPTPSPSGSVDPSASASAGPAAPRGRTTKPRPGGPTGASPTDGATPGEVSTPGESDEPGVEVQDPVAPTAADAGDDGLPVWVAPGLIAMLFLVAGATVLLRRRTSGP